MLLLNAFFFPFFLSMLQLPFNAQSVTLQAASCPLMPSECNPVLSQCKDAGSTNLLCFQEPTSSPEPNQGPLSMLNHINQQLFCSNFLVTELVLRF